MKPARFRYFAPTSLDEALALLDEHADAKILAGGQSLMPAMNLRLARPGVLIDLNGIPELAGIREAEGRLVIGGMTRHADLEFSELVGSRCPLLQEAASHIGFPAIRNRGTIGGSLAHNDPAATLPVVVACLGGAIVLRSRDGQRELEPEKFFLGVYTTAVTPAEIVTEVRVPVTAGPGHGSAWIELTRHAGDFTLVSAATHLRLEAGAITEVTLAIGGVGSGPIVVAGAEAVLGGQAPDGARLDRVGELAEALASPDSDLHATAEYRRAMIPVLVRRALETAVQRARGEA